MSRVQMLVVAQCVARGCLSGVARLLQASREMVVGQRVAGGLLFDGEVLLQLMEGSPDVVQRLAEQWLAQPLFTQAGVLAVCEPGVSSLASTAASTATSPSATGWQAGFVEPGALDEVVLAPSPHTMVSEFLRVLLLADVQ